MTLAQSDTNIPMQTVLVMSIGKPFKGSRCPQNSFSDLPKESKFLEFFVQPIEKKNYERKKWGGVMHVFQNGPCSLLS